MKKSQEIINLFKEKGITYMEFNTNEEVFCGVGTLGGCITCVGYDEDDKEETLIVEDEIRDTMLFDDMSENEQKWVGDYIIERIKFNDF